MSGGNLTIVKSGRRREEIAIFNRASRLAIFAGAAALAVANWSSAAVLTWDSSATTPLAPVDGLGTWDTATSNWSDGTNDNVWNNANNDTAVFGNGGTAGAVTVTSGGVTVGNITFNTVSAGAYNLTGGTITLGGTGADTITTNTAAATATTITAVLAGTPGSVAFTGTGALTMVPTAQTYNAPTSITSTTVSIGKGQNADVSLPFGAAGTTLTLNGATINGAGTSSGGSISYQTPYNVVVQGTNTINTGKALTLGNTNATLYTVSGSGTLVFNNSVSAQTSNIRASFSGTGSSAFTGTLEVTGTGVSNRIYAASGNFAGVPNGTMDLEGSTPFNPQTNSGGNTFTYGALSGTATTAVMAGGTAGSPTDVIGGLGLSTSFAGSITGNNILTLTGGSLTLTNAGNTYIGATNVNGGTLIINGKTTASTTTVGASGTLAGTGSIGTATTAGAVTVNGTIAPGAAPSTVGVLTLLDGLAFGATGTYSDDIDGVGGSDLLAVSGNITFGAGDTLNVNVPVGGTGGLTYTIATYTGAESGTFSLTNLPPGYAVNYGTGTNSSITIGPASVPEPASAALLAIAAAGLLGRRRRHN